MERARVSTMEARLVIVEFKMVMDVLCASFDVLKTDHLSPGYQIFEFTRESACACFKGAGGCD